MLIILEFVGVDQHNLSSDEHGESHETDGSEDEEEDPIIKARQKHKQVGACQICVVKMSVRTQTDNYPTVHIWYGTELLALHAWPILME